MKYDLPYDGISGYKGLAVAIVCRAVDDYKRVLSNPRVTNGSYNRIELKNFFNSEWIELLVDVDGRFIMASVEKEFFK